MLKKKKLYLVKREVFATSLKAAMTGRGTIYSIEEGLTPVNPPEEKKKPVSFQDKK